MVPCKIKVVEVSVNRKLADQLHIFPLAPCPLYQAGREWILRHYCRPLDLCENAWTAIHRIVYAIMSGAGSDIGGRCWVEDGKRAVVCCNDGLRPVVFELTRLDAQPS